MPEAPSGAPGLSRFRPFHSPPTLLSHRPPHPLSDQQSRRHLGRSPVPGATTQPGYQSQAITTLGYQLAWLRARLVANPGRQPGPFSLSSAWPPKLAWPPSESAAWLVCSAFPRRGRVPAAYLAAKPPVRFSPAWPPTRLAAIALAARAPGSGVWPAPHPGRHLPVWRPIHPGRPRPVWSGSSRLVRLVPSGPARPAWSGPSRLVGTSSGRRSPVRSDPGSAASRSATSCSAIRAPLARRVGHAKGRGRAAREVRAAAAASRTTRVKSRYGAASPCEVSQLRGEPVRSVATARRTRAKSRNCAVHNVSRCRGFAPRNGGRRVVAALRA
jgi:hypothetical protein